MLAYNLNRGTDDVRLFEAGHVYERRGERARERRNLLSRPPATRGAATSRSSAEPITFFDLKGDVEDLLASFQPSKLYFDDRRRRLLPSWALGARRDGWHTVAQFGQLHPDVAAARKLRQDVFVAELISAGSTSTSCASRAISASRLPGRGARFLVRVRRRGDLRADPQAVDGAGIARAASFAPAEIFRGENAGAASTRSCCGPCSSRTSGRCAKMKSRSGRGRSSRRWKGWAAYSALKTKIHHNSPQRHSG